MAHTYSKKRIANMDINKKCFMHNLPGNIQSGSSYLRGRHHVLFIIHALSSLLPSFVAFFFLSTYHSPDYRRIQPLYSVQEETAGFIQSYEEIILNLHDNRIFVFITYSSVLDPVTFPDEIALIKK